MEEEGFFATRTLSVVGLGLLAFATTILAGRHLEWLARRQSEQPCSALVRSRDGASNMNFLVRSLWLYE
jgi:hypothetical protein